MAKNKALEAYYKGKAARSKTKSHYGQVSKKTQTAGKQGKKNRKKSLEETKQVATKVGSSVKSNVVVDKTVEKKPEVKTTNNYKGGSRSGAFAPVSTSKGVEKRKGASTARTSAKEVGKDIKTAVNPHKGDTIQSVSNMKRKKGESDSEFLKRKYEASKKYNANGTLRQETKTKTGYTDEDRQKLAGQTEEELLKYYGKKYNRVKAFRDMWDEKGGLGDQFKDINGREATAEEKKDYYKKYWKPDYEEQTAKMAKEQANEYAKEQLPDTLYSKELSKNESAAVREYSKYVGKNGLGNKAIKGLGTLKYTLDDLGTTKPDGSKVTKKDLGKIKTDKKGKPIYQQVEARDYKGNVIKDKSGNPVMTDRNVAEELGSITATGANKGKFAAGFMEGSSPVDVFNSGVAEYNNAAKKVIQNTKESGAYMGGYMGGFMAQFMASGVPFVERGLMEQAVKRGVVEDADNVVGKLLNKAIGGAEKNAGIKFAENRGLELALEAPINFADAAKMSMDENGNVNTKALAFYMALNTGLTAGMGGAMEGVGVAFTRANSKRFADLYAKSLAGRATTDELLEMNKLQMKLAKAGQDVAVAKSNVANKALYSKTVADVVFDETSSAEKALNAMHGAAEHSEKMEYAQAIRDKALADIDTLREDRIKLLDEANHAEPDEAIKLRKQASVLQERMDYLSDIARGADSQFKVSAKVNRRALNELKTDLQRMSFKTGVNYRIVDDAAMRDIMRELGGNPEEGRFYRGYFYKNEKGELEVLINADSPQAHQIVVGHEMGHMIKDSSPEEFARMSELVREYAKKLDGYDELEAEIKEQYKGIKNISPEKIQEEIDCELLGRFIVGGDKAFIKEVAGDKSLFKRIVDYIKQLFDTTTSKELKSQYNKLHKMLLEAADEIDTAKVKAPEMKKANGEELRMSQSLIDESKPIKTLKDLEAKFKTVDDITPETVMRDGKVTKEADDAYAEAVKKKDWKRAQKFVDSVLEAKGYDIEALHGSDSFGFTRFDFEAMSAIDKNNNLYDTTMVFLTNKEAIAASYVKDAYAPPIREVKDARKWSVNEHGIVTDDISDATYFLGKEIMDLDVNDLAHGKVHEDSWYFGETKDGFEKYHVTLKVSKDSWEVKIEDYETFDEVYSTSQKKPTGVDVYDWRTEAAIDIENTIQDVWTSGKLGKVPVEPNKGIYRANIKMNKPYIVDCKGGNWREVPFPYKELTAEEKEWIKRLEKTDGYKRVVDGDNILLKTRDVGQLAANRGHDGVQFKNVRDVGGSNLNQPKGDTISDVSIIFNSNQFKVADAATYDDAKKLIPLSERGNEKNPDIRFSQELKDEKANPENIRIQSPKGEVQGRQVLTEPNRKVGEEGKRGLEEGGRNTEGVRVVSESVRRKMDKAGIGNSGLREASHEEFSKALDEARKANPRGDYVDGKSIEELKEHGAKCYLTDDGRAGICVEKDGNISGLFRHPDSTHKGVLRELLLTARENGGTKMDCFGDYLADAYEQCGFAKVNKIENNPKFSDIKDDVYTLMVTPESMNEVLYRIASGNFKESSEDIPYYSIKEYGDDAYDEALKARDKALDWQTKYMMNEDQIRSLDGDYEKLAKRATQIGGKYGEDTIGYTHFVDEMQEIVDRVASSRLDTVARRQDGSLILLNHSTMTGKYNAVDMSRANPEGDSGAGFYTTTNAREAEDNYSTSKGGDNEARIQRRAEEILAEAEDEGRELSVDDAFEEARQELEVGAETYHFYGETKNPVYVGSYRDADGNVIANETDLMDDFYNAIGGRREEWGEGQSEYSRLDFDSDDDFIAALDDEWAREFEAQVNEIAYRVEDIAENWEDAREAVEQMFYDRIFTDETLTFDEIKEFLNSNYYLFNDEGRIVNNEIARAITEELGHDSVWDNTIYQKWGWWSGAKENDFHIIFFHPNQVKLADAITRDEKGNIIPPSQRFDRGEVEFRYSQAKKKNIKVPKLDSLNNELKNYEAALKKAATKEEKRLIQEAIDKVKSRIDGAKKSDAPKEPPKKVSKTQAKAKIKEMRESQKIREEFNKYRDKSAKWAKYKEYADLEKERWDLIEEMGYKRGNKKQEARLKEIMDREAEIRDFDETKYKSFEEEKQAVQEELWNSFRNKRERAATKADIAELEGAKENIKDLQPKVDALTKDIEELEAKLRRARSESNIEKIKGQIRGKKSARTRLENKMKADADSMVKSADRMANRAEVSSKKIMKAKVGNPAVDEKALKPTRPVSELKNPKISKTDKDIKKKALKSKHAEDVNLTVLREREYIKEQYGNESGFFKVLEDAINNGFYNKKKGLSVQEAKDKARAELADLGYEQMKNLYLRTNPASDPFLAVERLQTLREEINRLVEAGKESTELHADEALLWQPMAEMSNFGGRALRAIREIRMLTPEGRRQVIYSEIERLQKRYQKRIKGGQIEVDPKKIERLAELEEGEERDALLQEINIDIWSQIPASFWEKMNEVRHCFMLFNARTHARNMFGNLVFAGIRKTSDEIEYAILNSAGVKSKIEAMGGSVDKTHVSRAEKREFKDYTKAEFDAVYKSSGSRNKYMEMGRPDGVPTINWKPMQDVINNNYWLLEKEDLKLTLVPAFENAYLGWCKSRCPEGTALKDFMNNMSASMKNKARHYALAQGEYATFRDACALSSWITGKKEFLAGMKGETWYGTVGYRALDTVLEGALPFVKTPVNIFRRSIDYSPIALLRSVSELYKATDVEIFKKGIHDLCTGLTGTGIMGIGYFLATQDVITLKTGSDKQGSGDAYIDRDMGFQDYSVKVTPPNWFGLNKNHDTWSWSLDWASPTAMSLFCGAAIHDQVQAGLEKLKDADTLGEKFAAFFNTQQAMNTFFAITSPMTDTSFMSSSKDTMQKFLERATRGTEDGKETDFAGAMAQLITGDLPKNYLTGFEPQLMAQIAGFTDPVQRDTRSTAKSEFVKGWDSAFKQLVSRVPVARTMLNPKLDRYGVDKINEDSTFARFLEAMIMPSNVKKINMNDRDRNLINIRNGIEDKTSDQYKYFWYPMSGNPTMDLADGKRMTYRELYDYGKKSRRFQARRFDEMFESASFKNMTPKMKADEVDSYDFLSQQYADWKVYGANYAVNTLKTREEHEVNSINAYRLQKGVGEDDEAANETYMKYYIRKEKYLQRAHADTEDGYYLKALSSLMSGDKDLQKAVAAAGDISDAKFESMQKYMEVKLKKAGGNKKVRRDMMFKELTDNTCNIVSNLDAKELKKATKGMKSVSAGMCAVMGNKPPEDYYRAMGHNWNSAQGGGGLQIKYNEDGKYDLENINKYKQEIKSLGDVTGDGKKGKADVMHYIENNLGITDPDEAACAYEVLYNYGRYANPYKSEINDWLEWGENKDDWWGTDVGGKGRGGRGRRGHGGGGGRGRKGKMPSTASGAINGKVTDPFATSNGSKASNLNDAYRKKVQKLRKQLQ